MTYTPALHAPPMWAHQQKEFENTAHLREWALWWEQRTGKSRVIVDTAAYQYEQGIINAVVVAAYPSAVHVNWATQEFPAYLPDRIKRHIVAWQSSKASSRSFQEDLQRLLTFPHLSILTFNCEALVTTKALWPFLQKLCHKRQVLFVADEANWGANPSSKRTIRAEALANRAVTRRILTGTPVEESPFDVFAMCNMLHRGCLGFTSITAFRAAYGEYESEVDENGKPILDEFGLPRKVPHFRTTYDPQSKRTKQTEYYVQTGYRNLSDLNERILRVGSRLLRSQCADLPEKIYKKSTFDLSPKQRKVYEELRVEYKLVLSSTHSIEAPNPLVRLGLLAMVARGYAPPRDELIPCPHCDAQGCDECYGTGLKRTATPRQLIDPENNPSLQALRDEVEALGKSPIIVWCRMLADVEDCVTTLTHLGRRVARFDGTVKTAGRIQAQQDFQNGQIDTLVATRAAARGIRLDRAEALIYYSNTYSLIDRAQSEDRAESLTNTKGTLVIDLIAKDTVDEHIVNALRNKKSIAQLVMGDPNLTWI